MGTELFFWVTISSLLFAMILFFRKSLVQDFVSMSTVIVFYATGTFGNIYNHIFFYLKMPFCMMRYIYS